LQRHGINRLPESHGDKPAERKFKAYPIGRIVGELLAPLPPAGVHRCP